MPFETRILTANAEAVAAAMREEYYEPEHLIKLDCGCEVDEHTARFEYEGDIVCESCMDMHVYNAYIEDWKSVAAAMGAREVFS